MKYIILITDGAAGWPLPDRDDRTCLEIARTPELNAMAREATLGLASTVPPGMEPGSAVACMSVMGYDPAVYYRGRAAIEAAGMDLPVSPDEVVFRCNLVTILDGKMASYSGGHITTPESRELVISLEQQIGGDGVHFFPGIAYRHLVKMKDQDDALEAVCTPPHDISGKPVKEFLPHGPGASVLLDIMERSKAVLADHPVNIGRKKVGNMPANMAWLFWGAGKVPSLPPFRKLHGHDAAVTSAVDLLRGLGRMAGMRILEIPGITDGPDNDYKAQAEGALKALESLDAVVVHIEPPDEAGHAGSADLKIKAIEDIDREVVSRIRAAGKDRVRVLVMPDHSTPVEVKTHVAEPVPFLLWGQGFQANGAARFTEKEARRTGLVIDRGREVIKMLFGGK